MTITTAEPRPLRPTPPASITLVRLLVAVQLVIAVTTVVLTGFLLLLAVIWASAAGGGDGIGFLVLAVIVAIAATALLGKVLTRLKPGDPDGRSALLVLEGFLALSLGALLLGTGVDWGVGAISSLPVVGLACSVLVMLVLQSPGARHWSRTAV